MHRFLSFHSALIGLVLTLAVAAVPLAARALSDADQLSALPWENRLTGMHVEPGWTLDSAPGNSITPTKEGIRIHAAENTFANVAIPLRKDFVRASVKVKGGNGVTWAPSLFFYWTPADWCQLSVISRKGGPVYHSAEMVDGRLHEHDLGDAGKAGFHMLAIELAANVIRYEGMDESGRRVTALSERPDPFHAPAAFLVFGKGHGNRMDYPAALLANNYRGNAGAASDCTFRDLSVRSLSLEEIRMTDEERARRDAKWSDPEGAAELARVQDPSFETVAKHFPAMKFPREIMGVPEHPKGIGLAANGDLQLNLDVTSATAPVAYFEVNGAKLETPLKKELIDGWKPMVTVKSNVAGMAAVQSSFGWSKDFSISNPLAAMTRLTLRNGTGQATHAAVTLKLKPADPACPPLAWNLDIPAHSSRSVQACAPFLFDREPFSKISADRFADLEKEVRGRWDDLLATGSRIVVPEPRVQNAFRAWQAYNMLNTHRRDGKLEICDGTGFYDMIYGYSAALYCYVLDLYGYTDRAQRYLDELLKLQQSDGLWYVNFGYADTGTMLYVLSKHYAITRDAAWLKKVMPRAVRMCDWIAEHRRESMHATHGRRAVVHGLVRFRPYCDYELPAYEYYSNAYLCVGMEHLADALTSAGMGDRATTIAAEAARFRQDISESMNAAIVTHDGVSMLPLMPDTRFLLHEADYTGNGYYGLVGSCLLETEFLGSRDKRADLVMNMLEHRNGLCMGVDQFFDSIDHAYTYGYLLTCMKRDEPKKVILGFYSSLAYGMSRDTYAAVEVTHIRTGDNYWTLPHTYSNTKQLRLLRNMIVREDNGNLLIGYEIPRLWLTPGKTVSADRMPTDYGRISVKLEASRDGHSVQVALEPPAPSVPEIRVRLRVPGNKPIRQVSGAKDARYDIQGETIVFHNLAAPVHVTAEF